MLRTLRVLCLSFVVLVVTCASTRVTAEEIRFTIDAGKHDRVNTPVRVPITLPEGEQLPAAGSWTVTIAGSDPIPAQVTRPGLLGMGKEGKGSDRDAELYFVLPSLKAGQEVEAVATKATDKGDAVQRYSWQTKTGEWSDLLRGKDTPVLRYMHRPLDESSDEERAATFKVYHHVYSPDGKQLLTKGAGGLFPHHRGLFYGFNKVTYGDGKKCDIWHCRDAYQQHNRFVAESAGDVLGRHLVEVDWHGIYKDKEKQPHDVVFAKELREMTAYKVPGGTMIDFVSRLTPLMGPIKLDGDPQHAGFHFRSSQEVAEKTKDKTYYLRVDGKGIPGEMRNWDHKSKSPDPRTVDLPWNALSMVVGDQRYTVVYMDSPTNPKPARYSERDYGRFGSYFPTRVNSDEQLVVKYRVWVQDGEMTVEQAAALDADFDDPPTVVVAPPYNTQTASPSQSAPEGFTALFNGKDLAGWQGLVGSPAKRAAMSPDELAAAQKKADKQMRDHWRVVDGVLEYDGKGNNLCTVNDYGDFELLLDWKIEAGGDSGVYLRGTPQVQIWDTKHEPIFKHGADKGSGGLWNNQKHPRDPLVHADNPVGEWNRFRIRMVGDKVSVWLNDQLVTDNVVMENYWQRDEPIYAKGPIELQHHGSKLYFKNIFIKEL